jgi:hypothetical protein
MIRPDRRSAATHITAIRHARELGANLFEQIS